MFLRILSILAFAAIAAPTHPQTLSGKDRELLLATARAQYYNLSFLGVKSFTCNVDIDWDALFKQFDGAPLPADSPMMVYLMKSRLGVKETVVSGAEVTWANSGTPPDAVADTASKLRSAIQKMLHGFFEAWTPLINGQFFLDKVASAKSTDAGYEVMEKPPNKDLDTLIFDKNLLLHHVSSISTEETTEIELKYLPTQQGLLLMVS
jgi:hypothetical protein